MITIKDKSTKYKFLKFRSLEEFNPTFLMSALVGDNLYASRATAYHINANEYKNDFLKSLKYKLNSEEEQTLIYLYKDKDKYQTPDSLGIFKIEVEDSEVSLILRDLLIKRDNIEFLEVFALLGIELAKEIKGVNNVLFKVEVPSWNLKLKKNLLSLNELAGLNFSHIGSATSITYKFEDKYMPSDKIGKTTFRDTVDIYEIKVSDIK